MTTIRYGIVLMLLTALTPFGAMAELAPEQVSGATTIDGAKAKELFDKGVLFVDPRSDSDWDAGRIPGAEHLEVNKRLNSDSLSEVIGKDDAVVFYCNGPKCKRSSTACAQAIEWGFTRVYYYRDGFPDWRRRGYPVE